MNTYPKALRLQPGLSLTHFSEIISCSASHLSMAYSGLRKLPPHSLEALKSLELAAEENGPQNCPAITNNKKAASTKVASTGGISQSIGFENQTV
jgi:hypothetical protein